MRLKVDTVGRESRYVCEDLDAGLPLHAHAPGSGLEHDVFCASGSITVYVAPSDVHPLDAGQRLVFDSTRWHGIYPRSVGAVFVNTAESDQPEFHSVLESPHNAPDWAK